MQFGKVDDPSIIDYTLPADAKETTAILAANKPKQDFKAYIGCAKWNKADLKGFYPKGTKDELTYYSTQFNSIELNATFYGMPSSEQVITWTEKTPADFKFFPKLTNTVSHFKRLINVKEPVEQFCDAISNFEDKLGMAFLQLHDNFKPKDFERLKIVATEFPKVIPLGVEVRNQEWFSNAAIASEFAKLFEDNGITNIIVDTAGRRDMLHMRLTTPTAFVRFVGANVDEIDKKRLDDWVERIVDWKKQGLENLYFFVHQNVELSSPLFSAYLTEKLNKALGTDLKIPVMANQSSPSLF